MHKTVPNNIVSTVYDLYYQLPYKCILMIVQIVHTLQTHRIGLLNFVLWVLEKSTVVLVHIKIKCMTTVLL